MAVDPSRISLPEKARTLDPRQHLSGQQLQQFEQTPQDIPTTLSCPSSNHDPPACHKAKDEDWPPLLRKLHAANMIDFLPRSQVLAEGRKLIKGGVVLRPTQT